MKQYLRKKITNILERQFYELIYQCACETKPSVKEKIRKQLIEETTKEIIKFY